LLHGAGGEGRVGQRVDERDQEFILVADRLDFVVRVEDFLFVQAQRFHDVLVRVGVDGFLERLAQQVLAAFRRRNVAVGAQHDVVGGQRVGRHEEAQVAFHQAALVFRQAVRVFPQLDVALHVHFLRHPVVGAAGQVFIPGPFVFERHQLVDVGFAVDDALVVGIHAHRDLVGAGFGAGGGLLGLRGWRGFFIPGQHDFLFLIETEDRGAKRGLASFK